jgi:hypothetical protein
MSRGFHSHVAGATARPLDDDLGWIPQDAKVSVERKLLGAVEETKVAGAETAT